MARHFVVFVPFSARLAVAGTTEMAGEQIAPDHILDSEGETSAGAAAPVVLHVLEFCKSTRRTA